MVKVKIPPDIIQVYPDGRVVEIHLKSTNKYTQEHNKQAELFKQTIQTCPHCKVTGRIWGGRCLACGEWYD